MSLLERYRAPIIGSLLALILIGDAVLLYRQTFSSSSEIVISPPSPEIQVYVEGEVASPGVYELRHGDLVLNVIEAAGGFTSEADRSSINLAATLRDG